jgi:ribosome maturation factor RimP
LIFVGESSILQRFVEIARTGLFLFVSSRIMMRVPEPLRQAINTCATQSAAHVIDVVIRGDQRRPVVEVYIDTPGAVTTDLCAEISRNISAIIDATEIISSGYRLEVSSPGIERPLGFSWQYPKHIGRELLLKLASTPGVPARRGSLLAVDDEGITVRFAGSEETRILFGDIREAKVAPPW